MRIDMKNMYCEIGEDKVAVLYFNRPPLNLFTLEVFSEFSEMYSKLEAKVMADEVRALVLASSLEKAFSAGDDVKEGPQNSDEAIVENEIARNCMTKMNNFIAPVVAVIDGYAMGGGYVLAATADYIVASDKSKYGFGEIDFAMPCNWGSTLLLASSYPLPQCKHLLMSGERFGADTALELNLVQKVLPSSEVMEEGLRIASMYAAKAPIAVRAIKLLLNTSAGGINEQGHLALENNLTRLTFDSEDCVEGVNAFREKREPVWKNR